MEKILTLANECLEDPDRLAGMVHFGLFAHNPDVDPVNPTIIIWIYYQAPEIPKNYIDPLYAPAPVAVESSITDLPGVNSHLGATRDGIACAKGFSRTLLPVSLDCYQIPALRNIVTIFADLLTEYRNSVMFLEGFPINRVAQIPSDGSAYPDRHGKLLISPLLTYAANASLNAAAWKIGNAIRAALLDGNGEKLKVYVNYARGDGEYGRDIWSRGMEGGEVEEAEEGV
ncbi:hypothetical protein EK21DRAFT_112562 [Setomelanomma holmii]|uniref:Uncharacterized protein n=1 Tax=Setomelanomma holmii TaxID=210430 RepID=A0A9P4HAJ2_9PLEO|nr:hypothetical protein EK21DRAFT_112562 [Setomelanomma holmii]